MADSEKGNSSTKESKAKASLLDEDFSKDFLSSWKSISAVGDDMDFNFEPVSKGKKKAFDFGMDMDFSLDDAFGKMSSFKIDMPDLDFSSSPKKITKSKEKPEEDSSKGNHLDKHGNFSFSFDFNGLDDFGLDAPSTKGGKSPSTEKSNKNNGSESEDLPRQVTKDTKETAEDSISKGPVVCEDAAFSKSEDLVVGDIPSVNCNSKSTVLSYPVQPKETQISSDKKLAEHPHKTDHQSYKEGEATSKKSCSPVREGIIGPISADKIPPSTDSFMPVESADVRMSSGTEKTMNSLSIHDEIQRKKEEISIQSHTQLNEMNCSTNTPLVEASVQINVSEESEISSPERKANSGSAEGSIVAQELPAAVDLTSATEKLILDKSPQQCSTDKMNINDGKNELGNSDSLGLSDTVDPSATCGKIALSPSDRSFAERQNPVLKDSPAPIGRGPTAAKTMLIRNEVPGAINSKFLVSQATNDGRTELSAYRYNKESSAYVGAVDRSNSVSCSSYGRSNHNDKKSDGNPSSCTKELMKPESVSEKSEKIAAGHNPPRDQEDTRNGKNKNDTSINKVPPNGQEAKNGLPSLLCEKMINNVKSSGFKIPSSSPAEKGTKAGNQGQGNLKDNFSSISSIQKLNIASNSCQRRITDKQLVTPTKQRNLASPGNFEKGTKLQAVTKMVSSISAEKQTPSTLSLKRKPSEAADVGPAKLHTPKRLSPNASRMCEVSDKEHEDGVQTQGKSLEGSRKNVKVECATPKFEFDQEANIEALQFSTMVENDKNVEKAEACAKELDNICNMLKKKHEEAKELLVRALVNNNNLLMLNHPVYEEKIRAVQKLASRLLATELEVNS